MLNKAKLWLERLLRRWAYEPFELSFLIRQLGSFSRAGVDLPKALRGTAKALHSERLRLAVLQIADRVQAGQGLSSALALHPELFNGPTVAVVQAGEKNGSLRELLADRSNWLALSSARRTQSVLIYALSLIVFLVVTFSIFLIFVYPTLKESFFNFGVRMPPMTAAYVFLSDFLRGHYLALAILAAAAFFGLRHAVRRWPIQAQRGLLLLPGLGELAQADRMGQALAVARTLIQSGVPVPDALAQAARVAGAYLGQGLERAAAAIRQGSDPAGSLAAQAELPDLLRWHFKEGAGRDLTQLFDEVSDIYEMRFKDYMQNVPKVLEAAFVVIFGLVLGSGVVAMFMPLFSFGDF